MTEEDLAINASHHISLLSLRSHKILLFRLMKAKGERDRADPGCLSLSEAQTEPSPATFHVLAQLWEIFVLEILQYLAVDIFQPFLIRAG